MKNGNLMAFGECAVLGQEHTFGANYCIHELIEDEGKLKG